MTIGHTTDYPAVKSAGPSKKQRFMRGLLFFLVPTLATWLVHATWDTGTCNTLPTTWFADKLSDGAPCTPTYCLCDFASHCIRNTCTNSPAAPLDMQLGYALYESATCEAGTESTVHMFASSGCMTANPTTSYEACCIVAGRFTLRAHSDSGTCCDASPTTMSFPHGCNAVPWSTTVFSKTTCISGAQDTCGMIEPPVCSNSTEPACFRDDMLISLGPGAPPLSLEELERVPECTVPHKVVRMDGLCAHMADGQEICLSPDHLVWQHNSPARADTLFPSGLLMTQYNTTSSIVRISRDYGPRVYFGLNCANTSIVHVNGIKASTFGSYHALPSLWMYWASKIVGITWASRIGSFLAHQIGY